MTKIQTTTFIRGKILGWKVYLDGVKYPKKPLDYYSDNEKSAVIKAFEDAGLDIAELKNIEFDETEVKQ